MIRTIRRAILAVALLLVVSASALAQDRAQDVLAQARAAVGDKGVLTGVTSLTVGASIRRVMESFGMELTSSTQLEFLLPDKYRRTEEISAGPMTRRITMALSGDQLLYDDGGAAAMVGMDPSKPPMRDETIKTLRDDAARMMTVLLLAPPANLGCTFTSGGVAEAPDGKADVVDMQGPNKLNLRLFFDTTSHRLLLATYQIESPDPAQIKEVTQKLTEKVKADPGNAQKIVQEMRDEMQKLPKKALTVQMHFSEPKTMNGITVPTKMTVEGAAQGQEEWTITSIKVNPPLKPESFVK